MLHRLLPRFYNIKYIYRHKSIGPEVLYQLTDLYMNKHFFLHNTGGVYV